MHRRTLHRNLHVEGSTFRQVADAACFEIACEMLVDTDAALSQVAAILNASELSAFTRACCRRSGQAPSTWRSNHRGVQRVRRSRSSHRPCADAERALGWARD
jgi:AraC-like DNA-binding protein